MSGPLDGVRVLEFAGMGPAPFAVMMLSDMGAEVVRIDRLGAPRPASPVPNPLHRGRRSAAVDLKHPAAVTVILRLAERADVLVEGFRPGTMERLGLGPEACAAVNPRLIYARVTGWGQDGPYAGLAGHDINYISVAGALDPVGRAGGPPVPPINLIGDYGGGGMFTAFGVACALFEARKSGRGQVIDAAMTDGAAVLTTALHWMLAAGTWNEARGTNRLDSGAHFYDVYATADGRYVSVGSIEPRFYAELRDRRPLPARTRPRCCGTGASVPPTSRSCVAPGRSDKRMPSVNERRQAGARSSMTPPVDSADPDTEDGRTEDDQTALGAWRLPDELADLAGTVRRFMAAEVRPLEDTLPHDTTGLPDELLLPLQEKARRLGLWSLSTPEEFGGAGLGVLGQAVVAEEAAKCRMGAYFPALGAFGGNPPSVMFSASPELFATYAAPMIAGQRGKAFTAISEASGGSDPASAIRCRAERTGDRYVINGEKMWTSHVAHADWGVVYARTGAQGDKRAISAFVVDADAPGLDKRPIGMLTAFSPYVLHFDNVVVPAANLIGAEGGGFELASRFLTRSRVTYGAGSLGIAQEALRIAIEWAKERTTFGVRLADRQAVQWQIADSEIELRAARLLIYQAAWKADRGEDVRVDASIAKLYSTEAAFRVVDRCMQILGALGLSKELPLERWFRDLRVKRLGEGATDIQRMVVARHLLR